ncbi:MAG TPA: hypothetical protein VF495_27595 [Phenylobacterium sp.]
MRRLIGRAPAPGPAVPPPASYAEALLAAGFDHEAYRRDYPFLEGLSDLEAAAHYHGSGRTERFDVRFLHPLPEARARAEALGVSAEDADLLRLDLAAAELRRADPYGRDVERTTHLLHTTPSHRPMLVVTDSHGMLYLVEDVLREGRLLPVPFLCTGASARGLGNPQSRGGATQRIREHLAARADEIADGVILLKFGQVDLEFVYDYRRIRDGRQAFNLDDALAFARESARSYVAFAESLRELTTARLVVTAALPPSLNDEALRAGYINAHIGELHADSGPEQLLADLQRLDMPDWKTRTELARAYNEDVAAHCAEAGLPFLDDFTPLLGADGLIDPGLLIWHGGTDHHLCAGSPAGRGAAGRFARQIAAL